MKQSTMNKAKILGFNVSDRLEYRVDTDTGISNGERVIFWNVIFPPDYPNQALHPVHDDADLEFLIRQYNNRFKDAEADAEYSRRNIEAILKLARRMKQG